MQTPVFVDKLTNTTIDAEGSKSVLLEQQDLKI
jgi:hypothetical protein